MSRTHFLSFPTRPALLGLLVLLSLHFPALAQAGPLQYYTYLLTASRPNLLETLSEAEQGQFDRHNQYLKVLRERGVLVMAGACQDGAFGLVIIEVADQQKAEEVMRQDPIVSSGVLRGELHHFYPPMFGADACPTPANQKPTPEP